VLAVKSLMEVDNNSELIVVNPAGILGEQLRPHPLHFYATNLSNYNIFQIFIIKLTTVSSNMEIKGQKVKRLTRKKYNKLSFLVQIKFITDD
jgi:hypothetical protein